MMVDFGPVAELLDKKLGKKMEMALIGAVMLHQFEAPTWQVTAVLLAGIIFQFVMDLCERIIFPLRLQKIGPAKVPPTSEELVTLFPDPIPPKEPEPTS